MLRMSAVFVEIENGVHVVCPFRGQKPWSLTLKTAFTHRKDGSFTPFGRLLLIARTVFIAHIGGLSV